jgi:hypothetical protein
MNVYMKDSTMNKSFWCSEIDPEAGLTFDRIQMKVEQCVVVPDVSVTRSTHFFCISQIDSITINPVPAGALTHSPAPTVTKRPAVNRISHH